MPLPPSSRPFVADMRRQANLGTIWSAIKWGGLDALLLVWGFWLTFLPSPSADAGSQLLGIAFLIAAAIGMGFVVRIAMRRLSPGLHPLDKELSAVGESAAAAGEIEAAFMGRTFAPRRSQIAGGWFCYVGRGLTIVRRLDRLVWVYRLRVTHRLNGIIPYRVSHHLMLWSRDGSVTAISGPRARLDKELEDLRAAASWLLFGYSEPLKETWNSDRAELIAYVDSIRQRAMAPAR
jgi:hypothetical protein